MTRAILAACGGFLLAVLWFDLMFDVQVLGHGESELPEPVLASIAGYYRRVTTEASPMNGLVGGVMLVGLGTALTRLLQRRRSLDAVALVLLALPVGLAAARVVPNAVRLGARLDSIGVQSHLARSICHDHLLCAGAVALFLAVVLCSREGAASARRPAEAESV